MVRQRYNENWPQCIVKDPKVVNWPFFSAFEAGQILGLLRCLAFGLSLRPNYC